MIRESITYKKAINRIASEVAVDGGRILVTGATGLIGSCVVDVFINANKYYGKKFDIFALGRNEQNLRRRFSDVDDINYLVQDVIEPIKIKNIDYIVHAASNADPNSYAFFPVETIITNIIGAKNVLDYCKANMTRSLFTSTFEIYGKIEQDEYQEDLYGVIDLNRIRSCYPESKRTAEMLFKSYADEYGIDCVIARLASIYGPTMKENDSKAHAQFIRKGIRGENIVLKSKGDQKRTYCYVMDAVSGILAVLFKGKKGEAYNVANDRSISTIANFAHKVADYVGTKVVFEVPDDVEKKGFSKPQNCILRTEKIKGIGWNGKYDLNAGINETMVIIKESLSDNSL